MDLNKNELIEKLGVVLSRYNDVVAVKEKMDNYVPDDIYIRQVEVPEFPEVEGGDENRSRFKNSNCHALSDEETANKIMALYESVYATPKEPKEPTKLSFTPPKKPIGLFLLYVATVIATLAGIVNFFNFVLEILTFSLDWGDLFKLVVVVFALIIAAATFIGSLFVLKAHKKKEKAARNEFDEKQQAIIDAHNEKLNQHKCDMEAYRQKEQAFINEYWAWRAIYLEHLAEEERVKAQLEIDRQAVVDEIERNELAPAQARLNEVNDLVGEEYLPAIDKLISLIQSGRADDLKEAINLYEEILYKERQLELEREKEAQRRYEEELRRIGEQRRHEEEMRLLREQEYARQREEERRRDEEERRYREEERRREQQERTRQDEQRRAEARQQREKTAAMYAEYHATHRQCQSCANMSHCRMAFRRPNCASYRPK